MLFSGRLSVIMGGKFPFQVLFVFLSNSLICRILRLAVMFRLVLGPAAFSNTACVIYLHLAFSLAWG